MPISTVDVIRGYQLVLVASKDTNVSMWTLNGGLVGIFGTHAWDLHDCSTWQDPDSNERSLPMAEMENLYLQVGRG